MLQTPLARLQFGHFLHIDPNALAVKQDKVDGLDGGRHGGHKVAGDGLKDQLGRCLLRETIPSATNGGESHRLEFLFVGQSQAVLHRLVQHLLALVGAPAWTVTVDDVLGRQTKAGSQHS